VLRADVDTDTVVADDEPAKSVAVSEKVYPVEGVNPLSVSEVELVVRVEGPPVIE
jgi:hypothetical protein